MTRRPSTRYQAGPRRLIPILLALALLAVAAYVLSQPAAQAPTAGPAAATLAAPESPPASGFQIGELTAVPGPTSGDFETGATAVETPARTPGATPRPTRTPRATATPADGLPTIAFGALPSQAQDTIRLIDRGGPYPYRQDGTVFQNREGLLPRKASGYYHEYTVKTPGESDRGPRRIVAGAEGELYYTADHYASFKRVVR